MNIQPSEFWSMHLPEFYLLYDALRGRDPDVDYAGSLTESDVDTLYRNLKS